MKKSTRILSVLLALTLFAAMAMGSGSDSSEVSDGGEEKPAVTIEEQVLLEQDGLKITAKEYINDAIWGDGVKLLLENNSDRNLSVGCNALIVNNYMIPDLFTSSVATGKMANETVWLSSNSMEAAGIENVGQIEIAFHVYDEESYDTVFDSEPVVIQTSCFDTMDTTPDDVGTELFSQDGVRIVGRFVDEDSFWGAAVLLYLENNSGRNVTVSCDDMSINGFMVSPLFSSTVYDGKMALDEITIFESDLEENGITSVDNIELTFRISDTDSYDTIAETGPIPFSAKPAE